MVQSIPQCPGQSHHRESVQPQMSAVPRWAGLELSSVAFSSLTFCKVTHQLSMVGWGVLHHASFDKIIWLVLEERGWWQLEPAVILGQG